MYRSGSKNNRIGAVIIRKEWVYEVEEVEYMSDRII